MEDTNITGAEIPWTVFKQVDYVSGNDYDSEIHLAVSDAAKVAMQSHVEQHVPDEWVDA